MKTFTDAQFAFKAAVRRAVQMAGGCNAAAGVTRVDAARLSRYGNIDAPEFAPIDVCFDLDQAAGSPVCLRAFADLYGFDLVARESVESQLMRDVTVLVGCTAEKVGKLASVTLNALADGKLTVNEWKEVEEVRSDLQSTVVDFGNAARKSLNNAS